tara:strand:+ start:163 stop:429 length:267 start_codon:yes stop_codon:yes gene_type:complete
MTKAVYLHQSKFEEIRSRLEWAEDLEEGAKQREVLEGAFKRLAALWMDRLAMSGNPSRDAAHHMIEAAYEAAELYLTTEEGELVIILR